MQQHERASEHFKKLADLALRHPIRCHLLAPDQRTWIIFLDWPDSCWVVGRIFLVPAIPGDAYLLEWDSRQGEMLPTQAWSDLEATHPLLAADLLALLNRDWGYRLGEAA